MIWAIGRAFYLWILVNCVHSVCEWNGIVKDERDCDLISGMNMTMMTLGPQDLDMLMSMGVRYQACWWISDNFTLFHLFSILSLSPFFQFYLCPPLHSSPFPLSCFLIPVPLSYSFSMSRLQWPFTPWVVSLTPNLSLPLFHLSLFVLCFQSITVSVELRVSL